MGGLIPHCSWSCSGHFGGRRLAEVTGEENEEHATAVSMNDTVPLNAKGCRWHCGGGLIPHCSWHCSGHFGGRRLAEGAAEENAAMEEATGEDHVTAVRMNDTIWLNATGCRWSCGGGLIPHCSWYCSGHVGKGCRWHCGGGLIPHCGWSCSGGFGGRRLAEVTGEENEEHATAVSMNDTVPLNATGCRWHCG